MAEGTSGESNVDGNPGGSGDGSQAGQGSQTPGGSQQSPGGTQQHSTQQHSQASGDSQSLQTEIAELKKELAATRKEAAGNRAKLKEFEDAKLSETEKLQNRIKELEEKERSWETERRAAQVAAAVTEAARKAGAKYPDAIHKLAAVQTDDDGKPVNVDAAVKAVKEQFPDLFATPGSADGGAGKGSAPPTKGWLRSNIDRSR